MAAGADRLQLIDVRTAAEWEAGHVAGSVNIPLAELAGRIGELDPSRPVVALCRAGSRSDDAVAVLRDHGLEADPLDGGLLRWKWAGLPLSGPLLEPLLPPGDQRLVEQGRTPEEADRFPAGLDDR